LKAWSGGHNIKMNWELFPSGWKSLARAWLQI